MIPENFPRAARRSGSGPDGPMFATPGSPPTDAAGLHITDEPARSGLNHRAAFRIIYVPFGALALAGSALTAIILVATLMLAPQPGEWSTQLRIGPARIALSVPALLRLATSPWFASLLRGRHFASRWGPLHVGWQATSRTLEVQCAPCSAVVPAFGAQPLRVPSLRLKMRRDGEQLTGSLEANAIDDAGHVDADAAPVSPDALLHANWQAQLTPHDLTLDITLTESPIAAAYGVLLPDASEMRRARIDGRFSLAAKLALPSGRIGFKASANGFAVSGLGTQALLNVRSTCGSEAELPTNGWLARAVIAAEDQRFFEHPGFDLDELAASFATNQDDGHVARGGSTITQQLAKLVFTGGERSASRKLRELLYAVEMERTLGKARILSLYLDNAPWGDGVCGAQAAAQHYFDRSAARLQPAQAVWLAAMLHNPGVELGHWSAQGTIDPVRLQWVAEGIRGVPRFGRRSRARLLKQVAQARFGAP